MIKTQDNLKEYKPSKWFHANLENRPLVLMRLFLFVPMVFLLIPNISANLFMLLFAVYMFSTIPCLLVFNRISHIAISGNNAIWRFLVNKNYARVIFIVLFILTQKYLDYLARHGNLAFYQV